MIRPGIRRLLRLPLSPRELAARETEEEIRLHLELRAERLQRQGLTPKDARAEARRRFGPEADTPGTLRRAARRREERRRIREWIDSVRQDVRYGGRQLARSPGFTAVVVATLALGIGASVALFSAGRAVVTESVPFPQAERLLSVDMPTPDGLGSIPSYRAFEVWKTQAERVVDLAGYTSGSSLIGNGERTIHAWSLLVTDRFFSILRPRLLLGRALAPADVSADAAPVAVVSERIWRELLGSDPEALGRPVLVGERPYTVVGVLAAGEAFPAPLDVWVPLTPEVEDLSSVNVSVIGRLRPGASFEQAEAALRTIQQALDAADPPEDEAGPAQILPLTGRNAEFHATAGVVLLVAVSFLLLIGIANAAGLMTTRALERRHELAVRASLGAGRRRIVRQLLVESTLLALVAGTAGVALAHLMLEALKAGVPRDLTRQILGWDQIGLDTHALAFALGVSVAAGLLFGLAPAFSVIRGDPTASLRTARAATADRAGGRLARLLLAGQIALALTLLLTTGLLTRSLAELMGAEPGFEAEGVVALEWILPRERYEGQRIVERFQVPLLEQLRATQGVQSAALVSHLPAGHPGPGPRREYRVEGAEPAAEPARAAWRPVTAEYLQTLRIPLLRGRHFTAADDEGAPRVGIISAALARRHWPRGASPLGQRLVIEDQAWTVVGVAGDVHHFGAGTGPTPTLYVPQAQSPTRSGYLAARVSGDPVRAGRLLRQRVWAVDRGAAAGEPRTMERIIRDSLAAQRVMTYLLAVYASLALLISVISLYTLVAHSVARRRREFGIQLALGALPRRVLAAAMAGGVTWVGVGIAVGLLLTAGGARLIGRLLHGVGPLDPLVYALVSGGTLCVAALASYLPARRAARVDPAIALRAD